MSMTRAEYEALASAINESHTVQGVDRESAVTVALEIASGLCATNDRFDPARFLAQTGLAISEQEISEYSHALFLRTQTGVGHARKEFHRSA